MMDNDAGSSSLSRRQLLRMIGVTAGNAAMYQAMTSLGFAAESPYRGPLDLQGTPPGASGLILGAGMAGMTAAYELRGAGYKVQVLEYNSRPGGRNWSLRGGDRFGADACHVRLSLGILDARIEHIPRDLPVDARRLNPFHDSVARAF